MSSSLCAGDFLAELRFTGCSEEDFPSELRPRDLASGTSLRSGCSTRLHRSSGAFSHLFVSASPVRLKGSEFAVRGIEAEFAFEIASDVPSAGVRHTAETVTEYIGNLLPAIELVGHRFSDWSKFDAPTLVADNAVHQAWIPGATRSDWHDLELASHTVQLIVNGEVKLTDRGGNVLGHPLNALAWLANELPRWGRSLKAGEFVTTGTCTDVYAAQPNDEICADFGVLGRVELKFDRR